MLWGEKINKNKTLTRYVSLKIRHDVCFLQFFSNLDYVLPLSVCHKFKVHFRGGVELKCVGEAWVIERGCNGVERCGLAAGGEQRWGRLGSIERGYCLEEGTCGWAREEEAPRERERGKKSQDKSGEVESRPERRGKEERKSRPEELGTTAGIAGETGRREGEKQGREEKKRSNKQHRGTVE
jgi:hypothetical protein